MILNIIDDLNNALIVQNRYRYILEGLKSTLIMALLALLFGFVFGTIIAIIRNNYKENKKFKILNFLCKVYVEIIRGTPSVLQLMIIYYVIFKTSSISGILIGSLAFGINSSAYVSEIIRSGIESVDRGQLEAGRAIGLNFYKTFFYIIFPQGLKNSLPSIGNELITLVKETAVAGYIGIMDLTKASDIISSRTYDYFLPLTLVAIIYLIITTLLSKSLKLLEKRFANHA